MTLTEGSRLGQYEIRGRLGTGGMGVVHRAYDTRLRREVAIKQVADSSGGGHVLREARSASALSHPNICAIHEVIESGGESFIVMELVEGRPLDELIPPRGMAPEAVIAYGRQIADAVLHAHARGIIHRDLKSGNVVVSADGRVKVLDFGLASRLSAREIHETTASADVAPMGGTLPYMAPELLRGDPANERSDIWAVGVILYELASGRRPFTGHTGYEISSAILERPPPPLEGVAPPLASVILKCLAREPQRRYQSAAELRGALDTLASLTGDRPSRSRARRLGWAVVGAAVVLLALAAGFTLRSRSQAAPAADVRALAVLPFTDLSGVQAFLADGMTDALISDLSKVPSLQVIARTTMMRHRDSRKPLAELARELDVDAVIEGTVLRDGGRVRVAVSLVDPATGRQRWGDSYDRDAGDVFTLQREIARTIAGELRLRGHLTSAGLLTEARPVDPAAHEAYLRGRYHWNRRTEAEVRKSLEYFDKAVAADPSFASAHVGLADGYNVLGFYVWLPPDQAFPRARAAAERALALEPANAEAHASLAYSRLYYDWNWPAAESSFRRALELNDGSAVAHQWYANYLTGMGRWDEALREMRRSWQLDPLSSIAGAAIGWIQWYARQYPQSIETLRTTLNLDPRFLQAHLWLAWAYGETGQMAEARRHAEQAVEFSERSPAAVAALARVAVLAGARDEAQALLDGLEKAGQRGYVPRHDLAIVHAALGNHQRALDLLDEAHARRENQLVFIRWDARLDPLRKEPRFKSLVERMRFP